MREYFDDNKLKQKDVRPTKLVGFEGFAKHHNVSIILYEPKKDNGKNGGSIWRLVYGKIQYKSNFPTIKIEYLEVTDFTSEILVYYRWTIIKRGHVQELKRKLHVQEIVCYIFSQILKSSEKVFYSGDAKFIYTDCHRGCKNR